MGVPMSPPTPMGFKPNPTQFPCSGTDGYALATNCIPSPPLPIINIFLLHYISLTDLYSFRTFEIHIREHLQRGYKCPYQINLLKSKVRKKNLNVDSPLRGLTFKFLN